MPLIVLSMLLFANENGYKVQEEVSTIWENITNDNLPELADWPYFKNELKTEVKKVS